MERNVYPLAICVDWSSYDLLWGGLEEWDALPLEFWDPASGEATRVSNSLFGLFESNDQHIGILKVLRLLF